MSRQRIHPIRITPAVLAGPVPPQSRIPPAAPALVAAFAAAHSAFRIRASTIPNPQSTIRNRPAFTTIELLVSMALMVVAMVGVVGIFNISSAAASKTAAHSDVLEASAALQIALTTQITGLAPGLLVIESPAPTLARADIHGGPRVFRVRHDRLVFIASGAVGQFQSSTDSRRGTPTAEDVEPVSSQEALVYFGPGIPLDAGGNQRDFDNETIGLTASEWMFCHRSILLMQTLTEADVTPWQQHWSGGSPLDISLFSSIGILMPGGTLDTRYVHGQADVVFAKPLPGVGIRLANAQTLTEAVRTLALDQLEPLWQPSWTPTTVNLVLNAAPDYYPPDYYTRSGFTFLPRLADFRIEWTDGRRIDPANGDFRTRWFGLAPDTDTASSPDPADPTSIGLMPYVARMRGTAGLTNPSNPNPANPDNPVDETAAFLNNIESSPGGITPDANAAYRAIWRTDNWQYRPKALRFTYRIYDAGNRLEQTTTSDLNQNGTADPDAAATKPLAKRFGLEFSIVIPVP